MIYFDNSATGGFKTSEAVLATLNSIKYLCANPGRSGHATSITGAKIVSETRENLANFFGANSSRVIFTKNCTEALNLAILGTAKKGGHVITTVYEHNSVLRPLYFLRDMGIITLSIVSPELDKPLDQVIYEHILPSTYMVVANSVSNVNGEQLPITKIGKICKDYNLLFLVDGAQGGGHISLSIKGQNISMLCLAGHKGLYGIMGSGALIFSDEVDINPLMHGGTGAETFLTTQPSAYPEKLEAGTLNLPAICALNEGVKYVCKNMAHFSEQLYLTTNNLIQSLNQIKGVKCYSTPNKCGIVAFSVNNLDSAYISDTLSSDFDIAVRGGYHCAPKMHEYLGTTKNGLVRASLAIQNSSREISVFISAVKKIASS